MTFSQNEIEDFSSFRAYQDDPSAFCCPSVTRAWIGPTASAPSPQAGSAPETPQCDASGFSDISGSLVASAARRRRRAAVQRSIGDREANWAAGLQASLASHCCLASTSQRLALCESPETTAIPEFNGNGA
jgi:hypothetical protein